MTGIGWPASLCCLLLAKQETDGSRKIDKNVEAAKFLKFHLARICYFKKNPKKRKICKYCTSQPKIRKNVKSVIDLACLKRKS